MIDLEELKAASERLNVSLSDVERDYVFGWIIGGFFETSSVARSMVLKGGNALRKGYFPSTRYSDDLDFSTARGIRPDDLLQEFNRVCRFASSGSGIEFDIERNRVVDVVAIDPTRQSIKLRLYFHDFSGVQGDIVLKVRIDVTEYDRLLLRPLTRRLIHQYSDSEQCNQEITCVALEEAIADKMKCLLQRRYSHDLFDLVYGAVINREIDIDRRLLVSTFLRKTIFEPSPGTAHALLASVPFESMRTFWSRIVCPASSLLGFDDAVSGAKDLLQALFAGSGRVPTPSSAYFPPELRNPIIEAGNERKLVSLAYDGVPRLVEPYALSFMRRKDGVAQEYFWCYDRTGGRRSGPGMKMLLQAGVRGLTVTEESFAPRHEIYLSKAGDRGAGGELAKQFASTPRRQSEASRRADSRRQFSVQCSSCGRTFTRTKLSGVIRKHLDGYGNRCPGRRGFRV